MSKYDNTDRARPFLDVAERIQWHRQIVGLTQKQYAQSILTKRSAFSLWEAGTHRLSLNGALAIHHKYGLTLDFLYLGDSDALPMTLRNAWLKDHPAYPVRAIQPDEIKHGGGDSRS